MSKEYYNQESTVYSNKRYLGEVNSYVKYFFRRRLALVVALVKRAVGAKKDLSVLEIACADGVVLRELNRQLPNTFSSLVGNDIAPQMIEVAKGLTPDNLFNYYVRGEEPVSQFDLVLSIGYLSPVMFKEEFAYVKERLKSDGYYVCSQAGRHSIQARLRIKNESYYQNYLSYRDVEKKIADDFVIISKRRVGFYLPKLWLWPRLARVIQPLVDQLFSLGGSLIGELFHETVYLLQKKTN